MKKTRNLILWGILLLGGISLVILSNTRIIEPKLRAAVFGMCFVWSRAISSVLYQQKNTGTIEKDELTKKVGYTALALSSQIICLIWWAVFLINAFYPFLEKYTAFDALIITINGMVLINFFAYQYYRKNPNKTWL